MSVRIITRVHYIEVKTSSVSGSLGGLTTTEADIKSEVVLG